MLLLEHAWGGRRRLLVGGGLACAAAHVGVAAGLLAQLPGLAVASIFVFTACFSATWGPAVWVVQSEILPQDVRARGSALATGCNWLTNALVGKLSPLLLDALGPYMYIGLGGICAASALFVALALPETQGVTLEDMGSLFPQGARSSPPTTRKSEGDAVLLAKAEASGVNR